MEATPDGQLKNDQVIGKYLLDPLLTADGRGKS
jgi:hypothetical protein